ncbi:MAG: thermopsin family protease [Thermoplasmata archaeon]|nr:thermopsin family protease [Thermoplasmata archaeon]
MRDAFLPNLNGHLGSGLVNGHIQPTYPTSPAPIGVADLGIVNESGTLVGTVLNTSRVAGTFAPTAFSGVSPDSGAPDAYGVQLNAVLTNVTLLGNTSYQFWTQNVMEYSTFSHQLAFVDNVWNFSGSSGALSTNAIAAHGPNGTQVGTTFYYALGPVLTMGYPFTLTLFLNSAAGPGADFVYFNYTLANATKTLSGSYDYVQFNSTPIGGGGGVPPSPVYRADGTIYNALGLPDDFEMDVVGPGGGSNFDALNASAALDLYYWSSTSSRFQVVPSAYNAGAETGETSAGLTTSWTTHGDLGLGGTSGPAIHLGQGPSLLFGAWNVTPSSVGQAVLHYRMAPSNGFTFIGVGSAPPLSEFGWAPGGSTYLLPPGTYSIWSVASEYAPIRSTTVLTLAGAFLNVTLTGAPALGVYTPLWAFGASDLSNISSSCGGGACTLYGNEFGPLGETGRGPGVSFPWFGEFNDFLFPVFPGIFLWNVQNVVVSSPPSLEVTTPPWLANATARFGTPATNDLGLFFYDDTNVTLAGGAAIGGWWFDSAYFGPSAPQYSVVFWNTSASSVVGNTFLTGGGALYLYGGENNSVENNTFLQYIPLAANAGSISGAVHGSNGVFDADFGDGRAPGAGCRCGDLLYNNLIGDFHTAYSPTLDPYTGLAPRLPFDSLWNVTPRSGLNIAGGDELGGNYWWDYGTSNDPYWVLPYNSSGRIALGGDEHPVVPGPLFTVTFQESGLPAGTSWHVGVYTSTGVAYNTSTGTVLTEKWPSGQYFLIANTLNGSYGIPNTQYLQVGSVNVTDNLTFYRIYSLTFHTVNFPIGSFWAITISNPQWGGFIELGNVAQFPAELFATGPYNFTVSPPAGYTADPMEGSLNLTSNTTITLAFSEVGAPGQLYLQFNPVGAQVWIDSQLVSNSSGSNLSVSLPAGLHSVEATASGYHPYFNNVTIQGGGTTTVLVVLVPLANNTGPGSGTNSNLAWEVAAGFGILALTLALVIGILATRRPPPPARPAWQYAVPPKR